MIGTTWQLQKCHTTTRKQLVRRTGFPLLIMIKKITKKARCNFTFMEFFFLAHLSHGEVLLVVRDPWERLLSAYRSFPLFFPFPFLIFSFLFKNAGRPFSPFLLSCNRSFSFFKQYSEICTQCLKEEVGVLLVIFINFQEQA